MSRRLAALIITGLLIFLVLPAGAQGVSLEELHIPVQKQVLSTGNFLHIYSGTVTRHQDQPAVPMPVTKADSPWDEQVPAEPEAGNDGSIPFSFIENTGQIADRNISFFVRGSGSTIYFTPAEVIMDNTRVLKAGNTTTLIRQWFPGANPQPTITGENELPGTANFLIGRDPSRWRSNLPTWGSVLYHNLYPGIDLRYYGSEGHLKREFCISPGADPDAISLRYAGISGITTDSDGSLNISTAVGIFRESTPSAYQEIGGHRTDVMVRYSVTGFDSAGFVTGPYDPAYPLIIDPKLDYSTYYGGTGNDGGSDVDDQVGFDFERSAITVDTSGNAYVTGFTTSHDFRTTAGVVNATAPGTTTANDDDVFILKLNPAGSTPVWSTYYGGSTNEFGTGIAVDASGYVFVTGYTNSADFLTTPGACNRTAIGGKDAFIVKLKPDGSAPEYATYYGGAGTGTAANDLARAIAIDSSGNAYITGSTRSLSFLTTPGALNTTKIGGTSRPDMFMVKLNPAGSAPLYATYYGGTDEDNGYGIAVGADGMVYVAGHTHSPNFRTTPGAANATEISSDGGEDAFIVKMDLSASSPVYATYYGGVDPDFATAIAVNSLGDVYITGQTQSADFRVTPGVVSTTLGGATDAFIVKLKPDGSAPLYATYYGGTNDDVGETIALGADGTAHVAGYTKSTNFPLTLNAFQSSFGGTADAFLLRLSSDGSTAVYSTYYGGSASDFGLGLALDSPGNVYLTGGTSSNDFATTSGAANSAFIGSVGNSDAFVFKFFMNSPVPNFTANTTLGYMPQGIQFNDTTTSVGIQYWNWSFGDNSWFNTTDANTRNVTHTYTGSGSYTVSLNVTNATTSDTKIRPSYVNISVPLPIPSFTSNVTSGPVLQGVRFNDTTLTTNIISWNWSFGDSSWFNTTDSSLRNATHTYSAIGSYMVSLGITNSSGISMPSSNTNTTSVANYFTVLALPVPDFFGSPRSGDAALNVQFNDSSLSYGTTAWNWSFGDTSWFNTTSGTLRNATHIYPAEGSYTISLSLTNSSGTNTTSRSGYIVVGPPPPIPDFTGSPRSGDVPLMVQFNDTSLSPGITRWNWSFGDTSWFNTTDPVLKNTTHAYTGSGSFLVGLSATNASGTNTTSKSDYITVNPLPTTTTAGNNTGVSSSGSSSGGSSGGSTSSGRAGIVSHVQPAHPAPVPPGAVVPEIPQAVPPSYYLTTTTIDIIPSWIQVLSGDKRSYILNRIEAEKAGYTVGILGDQVSASRAGSVLIINTENPRETHEGHITGTVRNVIFVVQPDPVQVGLGKADITAQASLPSIPDYAEVSITISDLVPDQTLNGFQHAAAGNGQEIASVAYTTAFRKDGILATGPGMIRMAASPAWVDQNGGVAFIRIARIGDDKLTEILTTTYSGTNGEGNLNFEAPTPHGLSIFGLVAVQCQGLTTCDNTTPAAGYPRNETATWLPALSGDSSGYVPVIAICLAGIATAFYAIRRRHRKYDWLFMR